MDYLELRTPLLAKQPDTIRDQYCSGPGDEIVLTLAWESSFSLCASLFGSRAGVMRSLYLPERPCSLTPYCPYGRAWQRSPSCYFFCAAIYLQPEHADALLLGLRGLAL